MNSLHVVRTSWGRRSTRSSGISGHTAALWMSMNEASRAEGGQVEEQRREGATWMYIGGGCTIDGQDIDSRAATLIFNDKREPGVGQISHH